MGVAYITKANLKSIAKDMVHSISGTNGIEAIYNVELRKVLAVPEIKFLSAIKLIIESINEPDILIKIIQFKENQISRERKDRKTRLIYLGGAPAYHNKNNCTRLISEYKNYDIPVQIQDKDIDKYRKFFLEQMELFERNREAFYAQVELKFNVKIQQVKEMQADNSGEANITNYELKTTDALLNEISSHINKMFEFKESNDVTSKVIGQFGFNTPKVMANPSTYKLNEDGLAIVKKWHSLKNKLKDLLISHLIVKYNPNFSFNGEMLDAFGFRKCTSCH
jgi:hypothetical protein